MSKAYFISRKIFSSDPYDIVFGKLERCLMELGGAFYADPASGTITVQDGKMGISGDFLFECRAQFKLERTSEGQYYLRGTVEKNPSTLFYLFLIGGLCVMWPIWGLNVWYLVIDLGQEYQKKLMNFENMLKH
ncbi:MAG: hypothetical protein MUC62_10200 [Candidatus Thermoplasmatota archaeon]|jgi:hypothetical protein|nr:hypothetical protein [Candidatus Thermoplasmatota archaeon]